MLIHIWLKGGQFNGSLTYQPHYENNTSCEGDEDQKQGSSVRPAVSTILLLTPCKKEITRNVTDYSYTLETR